MPSVRPFILSTGSGARLWPLSRQAYPRQFHKIFSSESLLQQTCGRLRAPLFLPPTILAGHEHRFIVGEQLQEAGVVAGDIVLEPVMRDSAPEAAVAALLAAREDDEQLVLLLPSHHFMADEAAFARAVERGAPAAREGAIVTFGVPPDDAQPRCRHVELGGEGAVARVARYMEELPAESARDCPDGNRSMCGAGIFLASARTLLESFRQHAPGMLSACRAAVEQGYRDLDFFRLDKDAYAAAESVSFDRAIMEKARDIRFVQLASGWNGIGSWSSVWTSQDKNPQGNAGQGDVRFHDTRNSYGYSESSCLTLLGLEDVVAVATADAILVASMRHVESVAGVVDTLRAEGRSEADSHRRVFRPWGWYEILSRGACYQVKCIMIKPGAKLSLQRHEHRAETWVMMSGLVEVTIGDEVRTLSENESAYIPIREKHRLANPGEAAAFLIEVQSGMYLGEDDILRYEDIYGRGHEN